MLQFLQKWIYCIIILLALSIRFWKIEYIPFANDADELAYIWAGQSLIEFGTPISWSSFQHTDTQWHWTEIPSDTVQDSKVPIAKFVRPWFDHSFILPLLMGGWSELLGYHFPSIPPALWYRLPFLLISGVNLLLIYQIARKVFGQWPAIFALSLVSFSPLFIFAGRMVVSENLMTTFILLSIYLFLTEQPLWSVLLATALGGIVKLPALCIAPVIGVSLFADKKYRQAVVYLLGVVALVVVTYGVYGASIDWPAFTAAMRDQSSRLLGWSNPAFIFSQPGFHTKAILDFSYYVVLFLGLGIFLVPSTKQVKILAGATLATWLTIWVTSAELDMLGWYKLPLFSLLAVNTASVFSLGKTPEDKQTLPLYPVLTTVTLLLFVTIVNNFGTIRFPEQPLPDAQLLRLVVAGILVLGLWLLNWKVPRKIVIAGCVTGLVVYALQAVYIANLYFAASCKDRTCPTPTVTLSQTVRTLLER